MVLSDVAQRGAQLTLYVAPRCTSGAAIIANLQRICAENPDAGELHIIETSDEIESPDGRLLLLTPALFHQRGGQAGSRQIVGDLASRDAVLHALELRETDASAELSEDIAEAVTAQMQRAMHELYGDDATLTNLTWAICNAGGVTWKAMVGVFALLHHPRATTAYAVALPIFDSRRYAIYPTLQIRQIETPSDAVRDVVARKYRA